MAADALEVNREIEHEQEEAACKEEGEPDGSGDAALGEDAGWQCSAVAEPDLGGDKENEEDATSDEETDNASAFPWVGGAAPLQSEEEADDGRDQDGSADEVELLDFVYKLCVPRLLVPLDM